jgi:hypothetical protein
VEFKPPPAAENITEPGIRRAAKGVMGSSFLVSTLILLLVVIAIVILAFLY